MHHLQKTLFFHYFMSVIRDDFHLNVKRESCPTLEGASKGLRSQDQEQDQEQEQDKDLSGHGSATPDGGSSDEAPSEKPKSSYPGGIWNWPGGNTQSAQEAHSKVDAFKAWTASN